MNKRWKPRLGEEYWFFAESKDMPWEDYRMSKMKRLVLACKCFQKENKSFNSWEKVKYKTKREAQAALRKLNRFIREEL